jgi:hypothetical protein
MALAPQCGCVAAKRLISKSTIGILNRFAADGQLQTY